MLKSLTIRNLVLVKNITINFDDGLIILSGETGAGKSVLLSAINYLFGEKGEIRQIRIGEEMAEIIGEFTPITEKHELHSIFAEQEIAVDNELIIRRIIKNDGKSKCFVNETPVSLNFLQKIAPLCVEIQTQNERHALLDAQNHLAMLDNFGRYADKLAQLRQAFDAMMSAKTQYEAAQLHQEQIAKDCAYWAESFAEIDAMGIADNEEEWRNNKRRELQNLEKNLQNIQEIINNLQDNHGIFKNLRQISKASLKLPDGEYRDNICTIADNINNLSSDLLQHAERALYDWQNSDENIVEIEERLYKLRELARKYRVPSHELNNLAADFALKLASHQQKLNAIPKLLHEFQNASKFYHDCAQNMRKLRMKAAENLQNMINPILVLLKLPHARVKIQLIERENPHRDGLDKVQFLASINPSQPFDFVHKTASGGELSRLLLAIKNAMALQDTHQTLVFDEIDSGVGGATASAIGKILQSLSQYQQCFVITHSPQIAAMGQSHFKIEKITENNQATTHIRLCDMNMRIEEIARMLSSDIITHEARAQAKLLLGLPA